MTPSNLTSLCNTFTALTSFPCPASYYTESAWVDWLMCLPHDPPTEKDLELVVRYVKRNQRPAGPYSPNSLRFSNLVVDTQKFLELRQMARAEARKPVRTERDRVLEQSGRPPQEQATERAARAILTDDQAFRRFQEWRKETGL